MEILMEMENLILRYLAGEVSDPETLHIQAWLKASKENRRLFARHKKLWLGSRALAGYDTENINQGKKTVDLKIHNYELQQRLQKANRRIRILASAASIALLLGLSTVMYVTRQDTAPKQERLFAGGEIEVPYGSKSMITLPDGSKVWVNAGSKISYTADFGETSRSVYLTGEAYFDIAKMEEIPFFVNTDIMKIKVYGTAFNVKAYKDDNSVETTLDRGAITIIRNDAPDREISVEPNQKITVMREQQLPASSVPTTPAVKASTIPVKPLDIKNVKNTDVITAWKDNRLVFDEEPLGSLAKQLERRYNVQIRFSKEKIKNIRFTGGIKEMPIDQVLEAISWNSQISYRIKGTEVTIMEKQ
jgi:ferric-dicitrate binding protein FerR (iron transport regulator)